MSTEGRILLIFADYNWVQLQVDTVALSLPAMAEGREEVEEEEEKDGGDMYTWQNSFWQPPSWIRQMMGLIKSSLFLNQFPEKTKRFTGNKHGYKQGHSVTDENAESELCWSSVLSVDVPYAS